MREDFIYDPMFSKETNDNFKIFHEIYEDCKEIMGSEKHLEPFTGEKSGPPTDEVMENFNKYLLKYTNETNRGVLRTLLVIGKPYKNHPVISDTIEILTNTLRKE
jgi:hypothetical protein